MTRVSVVLGQKLGYDTRYLKKRCLFNIIIFQGTLKIGIVIGNYA